MLDMSVFLVQQSKNNMLINIKYTMNIASL